MVGNHEQAIRLYQDVVNDSPDNLLNNNELDNPFDNDLHREKRLYYLWAANDLGRLWLLKDESPVNAAAIATSILEKGEWGLPRSLLSPDWPDDAWPYAVVAISIYRNLGWARVRAELPDKAIDPLQKAINIAKTYEMQYPSTFENYRDMSERIFTKTEKNISDFQKEYVESKFGKKIEELELEHQLKEGAYDDYRFKLRQEGAVAERGRTECRLATALDKALQMGVRVDFQFPAEKREISKQEIKERAIIAWKTCRDKSGLDGGGTPEEKLLRDSADHQIEILRSSYEVGVTEQSG